MSTGLFNRLFRSFQLPCIRSSSPARFCGCANCAYKWTVRQQMLTGHIHTMKTETGDDCDLRISAVGVRLRTFSQATAETGSTPAKCRLSPLRKKTFKLPAIVSELYNTVQHWFSCFFFSTKANQSDVALAISILLSSPSPITSASC